MTAYGISTYRVTDADGYRRYTERVIEVIANHGGEFIVVDHAPDVLEGDAPEVVVVIKFPSKDAARGWYDSEEYQAIKHLRTEHTSHGLALIVEEFG